MSDPTSSEHHHHECSMAAKHEIYLGFVIVQMAFRRSSACSPAAVPYPSSNRGYHGQFFKEQGLAICICLVLVHFNNCGICSGILPFHANRVVRVFCELWWVAVRCGRVREFLNEFLNVNRSVPLSPGSQWPGPRNIHIRRCLVPALCVPDDGTRQNPLLTRAGDRASLVVQTPF